MAGGQAGQGNPAGMRQGGPLLTVSTDGGGTVAPPVAIRAEGPAAGAGGGPATEGPPVQLATADVIQRRRACRPLCLTSGAGGRLSADASSLLARKASTGRSRTTMRDRAQRRRGSYGEPGRDDPARLASGRSA